MKKIILTNLIFIFFIIFFLEFIFNFFRLSNLKGIEPGLMITEENIHKMSPNSSGIHYGEKIFIDNKGFRVPNKNYTYNKKNKGSIFIIGDSTTFGNGVVEEKTFVGQLRKNFADINFYNSSVPGYNIKHFVANIDLIDNFSNIEKVLYFVTLNDIYGGDSILDLTKNKNLENYNHENISIKKNELISKINAYLNSRSYSYNFFKGVITDPSKRYFVNIKKSYKKSNLDNIRRYIALLQNKLNEKNIELKIYVLPYEFQTRNCSNENLIPQRKINMILNDLNVNYQDFTINFCEHAKPKTLFYKFDPMHLSIKGHSLIFNMIKNEI